MKLPRDSCICLQLLFFFVPTLSNRSQSEISPNASSHPPEHQTTNPTQPKPLSLRAGSDRFHRFARHALVEFEIAAAHADAADALALDDHRALHRRPTLRARG